MKLHPLITRPWVWHSTCCLIALLSSLPLLWPRMLPRSWREGSAECCGFVIFVCAVLSVVLLSVVFFYLLFRLRNMRAFGQLLLCAAQWGAAFLLFCIMAYFANVPLIAPPHHAITNRHAMEFAAPPAIPNDLLPGPNALCIPLVAASHSAESTGIVHPIPNLVTLASKHLDLLRSYISASPRWSLYTNDDTFYNKPGHVVFELQSADGIPGQVHAAFRLPAEQNRTPSGYTVIKPSDPMPGINSTDPALDLAVEITPGHYLLLAWRGGSSHNPQNIQRTINAALATIDGILQPLATDPTEDRLKQILEEPRTVSAEAPDILLSEPPLQFGFYQAVVLANPGEAGMFTLRVIEQAPFGKDTVTREAVDHVTHCLFSFPARFSENSGVLFRHDIPADLPPDQRKHILEHVPDDLRSNSPVFAICSGPSHRPFTAVFELSFTPDDKSRKERVLFRRNFTVQACGDTEQPSSLRGAVPKKGSR